MKMKPEDMIMISVDDHVVEPATMFDQHTPAKYKGKFPKCIRHREGYDYWHIASENLVFRHTGNGATVGRRPEEFGMDPAGFEEMRKGCWDVNARVDDMNRNGILASVNFTSWPGFFGQNFLKYQDKDLAAATVSAYNDWHIDEWCGSHPGRFIPLAILPMWNMSACVEETRRVLAKGCRALSLPPNPTRLGLPSFHNTYWDPLWNICEEENIITCLHIGDGTGAKTSIDAPVDVYYTNMPVSLYATAADLVYSPILRKYKNIKFALSEGGAGWIPHFLERADFTYKHHHQWTRQNFGGKLPSQVFLEHVFTCILDDKTALRDRHACGLDNMTFETDYPHSDCLWPNSPEVFWEGASELPREDIDKITYKNAARAFNFDPFKHMKKEACSVGALREKAGHVDTGYLDTGGKKLSAKSGEEGIVTLEYYEKVNMPNAA